MTDLEFCVDESKNKFRLLGEIARGGQGVVYKTQYPNIVLKLELEDNKPVAANLEARKKFLAVRTLPIPKNVNVTLPLNILEKYSGYTMKMMDDMISFKSAFSGAGDEQTLENSWLESIAEDNPDLAMIFFKLIKRGGLRRFFKAYLYAAQMLSEIHCAGLVYCDFSPNNIFISKDFDYCNVWLIDSDNLDFQKNTRKFCFYTRHIGAPELHQGEGGCTFYSDEFAFASTMFQQLTGHHPFDGALFDEQLEEIELDEAEFIRDCGSFAWVFDSDDEENFWDGGEIFLEFMPQEILNLFDLTFGKEKGLLNITRRPSMSEWSFVLAKTFDKIIHCPNCQMDFHGGNGKCSWCDTEIPVVKMSAKYESGGEIWTFAHEISEGSTVEIPMRILHGYRASELDDVAFKFTWTNKRFLITRSSEIFFAEFESAGIERTRAAKFETSEKEFFIHCKDAQNFKTTIEVRIENAVD